MPVSQAKPVEPEAPYTGPIIEEVTEEAPKPNKPNKAKKAPAPATPTAATAPSAAPPVASAPSASSAAKVFYKQLEHASFQDLTFIHAQVPTGSAQAGSSTYNGAQNENYSWSQTLKETTVEIPFPKGTKNKDLDIVIAKQKLKVGLKGKPPVLEGPLPEKIDMEDSTYVIESGVVEVTLVKTRETWWKNVVEGEPEIDTQKVDSVRSVHDYDDETQAGIRKIMFDQEQKKKGLPTSDQLSQEDMLRKAWDADGSPFKGQPFDPSVLAPTDGGGGMPGMPGGMPPGAFGPEP